MITIAYDPQTFLRQRAGGISRLFTDLIHEFDLDRDLGVRPSLPMRLSNSGLLSHDLGHLGFRSTPSWMPRGALYVPWWIRGYRSQRGGDIVHHTYYSRRFLEPRCAIPQVTTVYDMIPERYSGTKNFTASHLAKRLYVEQCDLVICISESTRRDLKAIYGDIARRTVVIPLAVGSGFRPGLEPLPGLPSEYLLYVGKRDGYKDFGLLPQALGHLRSLGIDIPLVVVGAPLTRMEVDDLDRCRIRDLVFQASLDDDALKRAYANCSLLVQTSRYEGFGLTPLEGMASGAPVVIANTSSMPEVGGDVARYFEPGDALSLAEAIHSSLADTEGRKDTVRRGIERAAKFSTRLLAERTALEYRRLLED